MSKKVTFGAKPQAAPSAPTADEWVRARATDGQTGETEAQTSQISSQAPQTPTEPMKRLTIDIPATLHAQIKSQCALRSTKMADEIRVLLEQHFATG